MSDPKRLLSDDAADDLGLTLLRSGRTLDADQARARRIALLGAAAVTAAASASTAKSSLFHGLLTKWVGLGLFTTVLAVGIAARLLASSPEHAITPTVRAVLAEHPLPGSTAVPAPAAQDEATTQKAPSTLVPGISIDSLPSALPGDGPAARPSDTTAKPGATLAARALAPSATPSAEPVAEAPPSTLADEVSSLREAREALAAGQTQRTMAALDAYLQRFPGGHLGLEAEELRIEALARSGHTAGAAARARSFLAAHPGSPYAPRLRALAFPNGEEPKN